MRGGASVLFDSWRGLVENRVRATLAEDERYDALGGAVFQLKAVFA